MYTRFKMSFWKHAPPKPTEAPKNPGPIRESASIARETSETSAPVSAKLRNEIMLLTRRASIALATNFGNSELQRFVVRILSLGAQFA